MKAREKVLPYLFLVPGLALSLLVVAYPFYIDLFFSVQKISSYFLPSEGFVGLANFIAVFNDPIFQIALRNSVILAGFSALLQSLVGLAVASFLSMKFRGGTIVKAFMLFPWIMPQPISAIIWKAILAPQYGVGILNTVLYNFGLIHQDINWLGNPILVWPVVISINVWQNYPFYAISLLAAMTAISKSSKESALVDGAGVWARFRYLTLAEIWPVLTIVNLFSIVWSFNGLGFIYTLTNGGPGYETQVVSVYTYTLMFGYYQLGQATAQALVMIAVQLGLLVFLIRTVGSGMRKN